MEKILNMEAYRQEKQLAIYINVNGASSSEIQAILTDIILKMNDIYGEDFKVKNGWWLILNQLICDELKERAEKR